MNKMIEIAKGFQTSVNIAYDLNNDDKIRGFIPTQSSFDVIEDILLSTSPTSTQRARILIGAYGRGKSHIVLVFLALLLKKDKNLFNTLLNKMKVNNLPLYEYALEYLKSSEKIMPIVVRGSSISLTQSFLSALQQTLSEEGFSDLMPETHFQAAANQIANWKTNYPETHQKFSKAISKPPSDFLLALEEYDVNAYEEFVQLYPKLTSGSLFNPFIGFDIVSLYENIAIKLKDKGFSGIYVIYDEFSKYLESSIAISTNSDIKMLQDFAEKCDRSNNPQMHLMLISHKDIANYIDSNLPKDKVDGWRGVSGRFKHMHLHNNYSQMYEIIAAVIKKDKNKWAEFKKKYQNRFDDLKDRYTKNDLLDKHNQKEIDNAVEGCYPLHPIATFILPRLSEKVAQNERTLFTFLSAEDKFTLSVFLKQAKGAFPLLTSDFIYDYFEPLFRKEPYTSEVHKIYKLTASVLRKVESKSLHAKIIKTIALIYLVEQFEKLPPMVDVIVDAYRDAVASPKEIHETLEELIERECVVYLKKSNHYLKIKETSGVNIQEEINKYIQQKLLNIDATDILNTSIFDSFMYPTAYNDNNDIIRYFDFTFISSKTYWGVENWNDFIVDKKSDGVIFAIIPENQSEIDKLEADVQKNKSEYRRIVFVLPKKFIDVNKDTLDYAAVTALKVEASEDEILSDECDIYIDDLSEVVSSFINNYARPENGNAYYFYRGRQYNFRRKAQLSGLLSDICNEVFYRTPVINNESVNKNELPTVAINSRTKLLAGLLANELTPNLGLTGTGQDVSIMRSTLIQTGIIENVDSNPTIQLMPPDNRMRDMLLEISTFFSVNAAKKSGAKFKELYDVLTLQDNGFGLKRGVIPIYIATILHLYKKNLVILHNDNEVKITPELLNDINQSPQNYSVVLENWNEEKAQYMALLETLFSKYVKEHEKGYNSFTYILLAMNQWYLSLPKYAKEATVIYEKGKSKNIDAAKRKFVNSLKQFDINPREFLFEKIFSIYGMDSFNVEVVDNIKATKNIYENAINNLIEALNSNVYIVFAASKSKGSLTSIIKDWYETLDERAKQNLYSGNENQILELMANITNDESAFIQRLAKAITFLRVEDWNNETFSEFINELKTFKKTVEVFNLYSVPEINASASYEIAFVDNEGNKELKRFNKGPYSGKAKLLLNDINSLLDDYGQAITEQEKRQILMELLEKLC